jgi:hypothetical protein
MSRTGTPQQNTFGTTTTGSQGTTYQAGSQTTTNQAFRERIAKRAYEKWMKRGCKHGNDLQDWTEAEAELLAEQQRTGNTGGSYR